MLVGNGLFMCLYLGDGNVVDKVRENRLRRMAKRQGYILQKCRRRDKLALDYGMYRLINKSTGLAWYRMFAGTDKFSLEEVERALDRGITR